jgi:hypothetical protein
LNPKIVFDNFSELEESETFKLRSGQIPSSSGSRFLIVPDNKLGYNSDDGSALKIEH